jgi:hypothetical protein
MAEFKKNPGNVERQTNRDHPEQYPTDKESLFDMYESEQNVDPIPMEDLNMEQKEEKQKGRTKTTSSSEKKYRTNLHD